jgi:hypothetical protein
VAPSTPRNPVDASRFTNAVELMPSLLGQVLAAPAKPVAAHPTIPATPGVYLFTERGRYLYVGQTRKLRVRLRQHVRPSASHYDAGLAWLLALDAAHDLELPRSRAEKQRDAVFAPLFVASKRRVADMDVRWVEIVDVIERTLFEVYAALALGTPYNSFETHRTRRPSDGSLGTRPNRWAGVARRTTPAAPAPRRGKTSAAGGA